MKYPWTTFWTMAACFTLVWGLGIWVGLTIVNVPTKSEHFAMEQIAQNNQMLKSLMATGQFYSIKRFGDQEVVLVPVAMRAFEVAQDGFKTKYGRYFEIQSSYRTSAAQDWLFKMFQLGKNPYPVENNGYSYHQVGLAVDVMEVDIKTAEPFLTAAGFNWLGDYDPVHFEYRWEGK